MISHVKHQNYVLPDYFKRYSSSTEKKKKGGHTFISEVIIWEKLN